MASDILKELQELESPLANYSRRMPYQVPQGYFDNIGREVSAKLNIATDKVPAWSKTTPYYVPEGYFNALPQQILDKVKSEQGNASKEMPFSIPEGYFSSLPDEILQKAKQADEKPAAGTIPLRRNRWQTLRLTAAAILLIMIGFASFQLQWLKPDTSVQQQLANVPDSAIQSYIQYHIDEFDTDMLASYLPEGSGSNISSQVSDEDIIQYLNETGWEETYLE